MFSVTLGVCTVKENFLDDGEDIFIHLGGKRWSFATSSPRKSITQPTAHRDDPRAGTWDVAA
jgi:hypothetical protein